MSQLWKVYVGGGRFIVRAPDEEAAIALAREAAVEYNPSRADVEKQPAGADLLPPSGPPAVLDVDYS